MSCGPTWRALLYESHASRRQEAAGQAKPGASLQQKLRNYAKAAGEEVTLVLIRYLNERFLYRLSLSPYRERFVLRGATLFTAWNAERRCATRDSGKGDRGSNGQKRPRSKPFILDIADISFVWYP